MPVEPLIDCLPDVVLLLRRDGIVLDHGGGHGFSGLKLDQHSVGKSLHDVWPEAVAALLTRLARRAISVRSSAEARFNDQGNSYEARAHVRGPDRALCLLRNVSPVVPAVDGSDKRRRPQLDRRRFLRRFQDSISFASLCEKPAAVAVIYVDGIADIAQVMDLKIAEQVMEAALAGLPPLTPGASGEKSWWYLGQLKDSLLALVLETSDRDAIDKLLCDLCSHLRKPISVGDAAFHLTPYAGVAMLGRDATTPRILLDYARAAAMQARRSGSAKVCFFTDTLRLRSLARLDVARELSEAIANRDIRLRYVGRYDLATDRLVTWVGYLCWIHPVRGEVRPVEFLRVAEITGLAAALSRAVLACLQEDFAALAPQWDDDVRISFGALRHHILHDDFAADVASLLSAGVVPAKRLELRISEKTFIARDVPALRKLAQLGVQLVVDEVGRGLGSLDALARAPIWGLQLDRACVTAARSDEVALKVCRAGIGVASALGLTSIATGVDDVQQRQTLLALGCRYGSGDYYQDAIPDAMRPYRLAGSE